MIFLVGTHSECGSWRLLLYCNWSCALATWHGTDPFGVHMILKPRSLLPRPSVPCYTSIWVTGMLTPSALKEWRRSSSLQAERHLLVFSLWWNSSVDLQRLLVWSERGIKHFTLCRCFHLLFWKGRAWFDLICNLFVHFGRTLLMFLQRVVAVLPLYRAPRKKNPHPDSAIDFETARCLTFSTCCCKKTSGTYNYADSASPLLASEIAEIPASISEYVVELVSTIRASKPV